MDVTGRPHVIGRFIEQHVSEASALHGNRSALLSGPQTTLEDLSRLDRRLGGHLDGISVAKEHGWAFCQMALESPSASDIFTAAAAAIERNRVADIARLLAITEVIPLTTRGLLAAFGWVERDSLRGKVADFLGAADPLKRFVGVAACAMHRVEPGDLSSLIGDPHPLVRSRALRLVGEIGARNSAHACAAANRDENPDCRFWAAWSAVLLGNAGYALDALTAAAMVRSAEQSRALRLSLQANRPDRAHHVLQALAVEPTNLRWVIWGSGIVGDPTYVPWLITRMADDNVARLAGEAFSVITGADLGRMDLERTPPEHIENGLNDDPDDAVVDLDSDDGLPWPDPQKVHRWWDANKSRFLTGQRYFVGAPVERAHCIAVLKNGYQRQRVLAAHYLCLMNPGTPLFNTSAPTWRQQRLLAGM